jgi:hypothetical protein
MVLPQHQYLFKFCTFEQQLKASYDTLSDWIQMVEEAIKVLEYQEAKLKEELRNFFPHNSNTMHSSSDSTYGIKSTTTTTTDSLTATTLSTKTLTDTMTTSTGNSFNYTQTYPTHDSKITDSSMSSHSQQIFTGRRDIFWHQLN